MSTGGIEVARFGHASEARDAARRLLAAGVAPDVRREEGVHVLVVAASDATTAAEVLDLDPAELAARPRVEASPEETRATAGSAAVEGVPPVGDDEDDPAELVVDERGFVVVALAGDDDEARGIAATLVEQGIGAEVRSAFETGHANPMTAPGDPQAVQVLDIDADRALQVLGLDGLPARLALPSTPQEADAAPAPVDELGTQAPSGQLRRRTEREEARPYLGGRVLLTRRQLRTMIVVYLAALILIPIGFYYFTRWVLAPDVEEPELRSRFDIPSIVVAPPNEPWVSPF